MTFSLRRRPRLSVFRSNKYIYGQIIDDKKGGTLVAAGDIKLKMGKTRPLTKAERAFEVGKLLAEKAKKLGIRTIVFDRGSYKYHGRVKSLAEGAREGGLKF